MEYHVRTEVASPVCSQFNGEMVQRDKNRHIFSEKFALVPKLQDVVRIFESEFKLLQVDSVWLLKKEYSGIPIALLGCVVVYIPIALWGSP